MNDRDILNHAGKISHELAKQTAEEIYEEFNQKHIQQNDYAENDFAKIINEIASRRHKKREK